MATLCDGEGSAVCAEEMAKLNFWSSLPLMFSDLFFLLLSISVVILYSSVPPSAPVNHAFECTALAANQTRIRIKGFIIFYFKILGIVHVNIEHII